MFCSEVAYTLVPDADQVAKDLKVSHFDCGAMTQNTVYALSQVRIATSHLRNQKLVRRKSFSTLNISGLRLKQQSVEYNINARSGTVDISSIDHTIAGITIDLVISPEKCRSLAKGRMIYLADQFLGVEYDTKNSIVITDGSTSDDNRNHCTARGRITRDTFVPHKQRTILKVRMSIGKVLSDSSQVLPCALEELGCETTSMDHYAYIWD